MGVLLQDLRYASRALRKSPGFAAVAILTLALGIGANTAIFSVVNAVLLRPLPFPQGSRLVYLFGTSPARGIDTDVTSFANYLDWRSASTAFDGVAAYDTAAMNLGGGATPESVTAATVSANLLDVMGVRPAIGRGFREGEDGPAAGGIAILGNGIWKRRFGADPGIVGRSILLDEQPTVVVGVLPPGVEFPSGADVWVPIRYPADPEPGRGALFLPVVARLKPGVSLAAAQTQMRAIAAKLERDHPRTNASWSVAVVPLRGFMVRNYRSMVLLLLGAVALVLLIACANVANLLLARGAAREREMATRAALGASRAAMIRQLLTESALLSLLGGALGVAVAAWGVSLLTAAAPVDLPAWMTPSIDATVLFFTLGAALLTAFVFGTVPALHSLRESLVAGLGGAGRQGGSARAARSQNLLVVAEVALALVLLAGAGLVVKSLLRLEGVSPGFRPDRLIAGTVSLTGPRYEKSEPILQFADSALERIRRMPSTESAAIVSTLPFSGNYSDTGFRIEGEPEPPPEKRPIAGFDSVTPGYFRTMGIPLRGRDFSSQERGASPGVAIINEAMARRFWPGQDPLGKRFWRRKDTPLTIVGVSGTIRRSRLSDLEPPHFYIPFQQTASRNLGFVVRTKSNPAAAISELTSAVHEADPMLSVGNPASFQSMLKDSLAQPRFASLLLGTFAGLALLLAALGLYGVLAYSVARRTAEIGIRMAIGASRRDVLSLVGRQSLRLTAIGLAIGIAAALAMSGLLSGLLFEVRPWDPATLLVVTVLLLGTTVLATWIPARRAVAISPIEALREE